MPSKAVVSWGGSKERGCKNMIPSWALFGVIVLSGAVAVTANTLYPHVKSEEDKSRLAKDAKAIVLPEVQQDLTIAIAYLKTLQSGDMPTYTLQTTAWETVSRGGLLLGLSSQEITKLLNIYRLANEVNFASAQLLDSTIGIRSALGTARQTQQLFRATLQQKLTEFETAAEEILKSG